MGSTIITYTPRGGSTPRTVTLGTAPPRELRSVATLLTLTDSLA